jgi:DNA-binding transcriptional MerR regulator
VSQTTTRGYRSGDLARRARVSADTVRLYERRGLLPKARRSSNGYRLYPHDALERLLLIQRSLAFGFSLRELEKFLSARDSGSPLCREVRARAAERLDEVETLLAELSAFRDELRETLERWNSRMASQRDGRPAHLLESLPADSGARVGAALLTGQRFLRRPKRKEKP